MKKLAQGFTRSARNTGFTLIEVLIVVTLLGLSVIPIIFNARQVSRTQALRSWTSVLADDLQTARSYSRDVKDEMAWGLISENNTSYSIVSGVPGDYEIVQTRTLDSGVSLTETFTVWFQAGSGSLAGLQIINIVNDAGASYEISINPVGVIQTKQL